MGRVLVVYASKHGQTAKIAARLSEELTHLGHTAELRAVRDLAAVDGLEKWDAVLIGAPVYTGRYPRRLRKWVGARAARLSKMPTAFFSVCLGILEAGNAATQRAEHEIVNDFLESSHWRPELTRIFAGALPYTRYNWLVRRLMRRIAAKAGGDTDVTRDFEYTDWEQVRGLAREFGALLAGGAR